MKNAEELFNKAYYKKNLILDTTHMMLAVIDAEQFESALSEYNSELISEIEKKIDKLEESRSGGRLTGAALAGVNITIIRLTEIINLIKVT